MFIIKVAGGLYDGQTVLTDGWIPYGASTKQMMMLGLSIAKFDDLADAQDFVMGRENHTRAGDYGVGASLIVDEIDGDIKYERQ